ncbi:hypothetical protein ACTXT7_009149 [Hymenolepis weldensis]
MGARISSLVRNTLAQVKFSTSAKNPKDYVKNYRDNHINGVADLPHATQISMLLCEFTRSDHYLCSSNFQPMGPADLTGEKMNSKLSLALGDNSSLFILTIHEDENVYHYKTCSDVSISFLVSDLLAKH